MSASTPRSRLIFWIRWLELAALLGAGVYALIFQLQLPSRFPNDADYRQLATQIEREAQPTDVVLLFPWWTDRARLFVPEKIRVVGYLGSDFDPLEDYARIWLIAEPHLPRADLSSFLRHFQKERLLKGPVQRFGNLELSLFENRLHRPKTFSAVGALADAHLYLESANGQRTECRFDGRVHRCPIGNLYVAAEWHEIHFSPQRCLWMHPPGGTTRLVAEFPLPSSADKLVLRGGLVWDREYFRRGMTPASIRVETGDGKRLIDLSIPPGTEGLQRVEAPWSPAGPTATVRISVGSENPELRDICVDLIGQRNSSREGA